MDRPPMSIDRAGQSWLITSGAIAVLCGMYAKNTTWPYSFAGVVVFGCVTALMFLLLRLVVRRLRDGYGWARLALGALTLLLIIPAVDILLLLPSGRQSVFWLMVAGLAAIGTIAVGTVAMMFSVAPPSNKYLRDCARARNLARPPVGPPPPEVTLAATLWIVACGLLAVGFLVGASNIGWRLAGLAGCTTSAFAARPFTAGSLVARRWFAAFAFLTWLIVIPIVKVTPIPGMVLADLLATLGALFGALVMTYLPASTAYFRRANRRAAEGLGRA